MAAAKKAPVAEQPEVIEQQDAVRQPVWSSDRHGRLHPDVVSAARDDAGIAPQERLIEHTRTGVIKGS